MSGLPFPRSASPGDVLIWILELFQRLVILLHRLGAYLLGGD